ncbi:hypothetical protein GQ457_17G009010 [Hibiscus cannabinus]
MALLFVFSLILGSLLFGGPVRSFLLRLSRTPLLGWLFVNCTGYNSEDVAYTILAIWFARNKLLHEGEGCSSKIVDPDDDFSVIRPLVRDIKALASHFVGCRFIFSPHTCNKAVHAVASYGRRVRSNHIWIEEAPLEVSVLADADRTSLNPS